MPADRKFLIDKFVKTQHFVALPATTAAIAYDDCACTASSPMILTHGRAARFAPIQTLITICAIITICATIFAVFVSVFNAVGESGFCAAFVV